MTLKETVEKYRTLSREFGRPVALSAFGMGPEETARHFSALDEDYHISRFLQFSMSTAVARTKDQSYLINGFPQTHISINAEIETIL